MQLEERLRAHYSVVLEHMEAQLKMALRLQVRERAFICEAQQQES